MSPSTEQNNKCQRTVAKDGIVQYKEVEKSKLNVVL